MPQAEWLQPPFSAALCRPPLVGFTGFTGFCRPGTMAAAIEITDSTAFRISSPNDNAEAFTGDYTFVSSHRGKPIFAFCA